MALPSLNLANSLIRNDILNKNYETKKILDVHIPTSGSNINRWFDNFS